jgi:hypothetical protein
MTEVIRIYLIVLDSTDGAGVSPLGLFTYVK